MMATYQNYFFSQFYILNDILKPLMTFISYNFLFNTALGVYLDPEFKVRDPTLYNININNKHVSVKVYVWDKLYV